jgi:hypothetical protein
VKTSHYNEEKALAELERAITRMMEEEQKEKEMFP